MSSFQYNSFKIFFDNIIEQILYFIIISRLKKCFELTLSQFEKNIN